MRIAKTLQRKYFNWQEEKKEKMWFPYALTLATTAFLTWESSPRRRRRTRRLVRKCWASVLAPAIEGASDLACNVYYHVCKEYQGCLKSQPQSICSVAAMMMPIVFVVGAGRKGALMACTLSPFLALVLTSFEEVSDNENIDKSEDPDAPVDRVVGHRLKQTKPVSDRNLELLVHNVSHTDLVLSFKPSKKNVTQVQDDDDNIALCRPRFSFFDLYSRKALDATKSGKDLNVLKSPRYQRSLNTPRLRIQKDPTDHPTTPIGITLPNPVRVDELKNLRFRGRDWSLVEDVETGTIGRIFFPLLSTLLPQWKQRITEKSYTKPPHRVLILVTGVGTPRNWTHSMAGNSTEIAADLIRVFLKCVDPEMQVIHIHSSSNLFRYDENVRFVDRELVPTVAAFRDAHARGLPYPTSPVSLAGTSVSLYLQRYQGKSTFNVDWLKSMSVTLSFADGSPARTHAIQACLRPYKPTYFHFWQLKTFWHESKIVDDDIEVHTFETMNVMPPLDVSKCRDEWITATVAEMKTFLNDTLHTHAQRDAFWIRKSHKKVLAVLLVQTPSMTKPVLYRGTNMEVSMPTGSLCAERNVIGSALARHPGLKREDLKLVAVLSVPPVERVQSGIDRVTSTSNVASTGERSSTNSLESYLEADPHGLDESSEWVLADASVNAPPLRRIPLFSSERCKRTVIVHSEKDINPLAPCGTCQEWLKKIAEANPHFRVLTFTDANCNGVYVTPCQEQ